jgi:hypothetical protein
MAAEALHPDAEMDRDALRTAKESGLFREVLAAELLDTPHAQVIVRPDADDGKHDWTARVEQALALSPGARVGVAAEDASLAASAAVRIAVSVADGGRRVVIVDGSVRSPVIAKALEGDGDEGLVDSVLFGVSTAVTARRTLAAGVSLMTSGSVPVSAEDVFRSDSFESTLRGFAQDVIVFVALPAAFLTAAAHALSDVVLLGRTATELVGVGRSAADSPGLGSLRAVGLLVGRPLPERPPGLAESSSVADAVRPEPAAAEPAPEQAAPFEQPGVPTRGAPPPSQASTYARRSRVRTAARTPAPAARKRPRRATPLVLGVLAVVIVAAVTAWQLGALDSLRVGATTPSGTGRPTQRPQAGAPPVVAADDATVPAAGDTTPIPGGAPAPPAVAAAATEAPQTGATELQGQTPARASLSGPGGRYVVYVSSHRVETAAITDAAALLGMDVATAVVRTEVGDSGIWYRVRVAGGYPTLAAAREALEVVKGLPYDGAWIERTPESQ